MKRLPLVTLEIAWADLLGQKRSDMPDAVRRQRWLQWLAIPGNTVADSWRCGDGCGGCVHLDPDGWCSMEQLPSAVNPVLTILHGVGGMACMGLGYQRKEGGAE